MMDLEVILIVEHNMPCREANLVLAEVMREFVVLLQGVVRSVVRELLLFGANPALDVHHFEVLQNRVFVVEGLFAELGVRWGEVRRSKGGIRSRFRLCP